MCTPSPVNLFQSTQPRGLRRAIRHPLYTEVAISIHAATRAATRQGQDCDGRCRNFNPRSHEGCDTSNSIDVPSVRFQSTQPRGLRPCFCHLSCERVAISIHAATRAATHALRALISKHQISIHAATRAATRQAHKGRPRRVISIHAATRAATKFKGGKSDPTQFQSTQPRGLRRHRRETPHDHLKISIHAATRAATRHTFATKMAEADFNPRSHEGCDATAERNSRHLADFNPRSHEGCDASPPKPWIIAKFQSTQPRGLRRGYFLASNDDKGISIHAATRAATIHRVDTGVLEEAISIHAATRAATRKETIMTIDELFQSTQPRGLRQPWRLACFEVRTYFNPRSHEGCDLYTATVKASVGFQSTQPRGLRHHSDHLAYC